MKRIVFCITWLIGVLRKLRRLIWVRYSRSYNMNDLSMSDVIDIKYADFNGHITISGNNEDLNVIYHVKNGKLDLEYLKIKDQLKDK